MKRQLPFILIGVLLAACAAGVFLTRGPASNRPENKKAAVQTIDSRLLDTARALSTEADTADDEAIAQEILHDADHEFDQAFASALREAAASAPPPAGPLKQLGGRVSAIKSRIAKAQEAAAKLAKPAESDDDAATRLELINAQIALDQDELEDVRQELARRGGDRHATLERMKKAHETAEHVPAVAKLGSPPPTRTMWEQAAAWLALYGRRGRIEAARQQAATRAATLGREHDALERLLAKNPVAVVSAAPSSDEDEEEDPEEMLARLKQLSDQRKTLAELDKRIDDAQQIAAGYGRWEAALDLRLKAILHLLLISTAAILAVLMAVFALERAIRLAYRRKGDPRGTHQARMLASIVVQLLGSAVAVFIVFGMPSQTSTIIGLTTAGLTVALKDFIVGFCGWFALIGKNGIRVGDWVEIEGVGGEVIEVGLLKTVLLEMGDWTNSGHPTGRRVSFVNKYAIENHYFNFSTAGQWLWDELRMTLADTSTAYQMATQIRDMVEAETEADARVAEQEWERVTRQYGSRAFSAKPAVDLRPTVGGLEVRVRYITRAPQRYEVKSRLLDKTVALVHAPTSPATS